MVTRTPNTTVDTAVISCRDVGVRIDQNWLVRDISFSAPAGQLVVLIGPNGAGKSTLLSLLAGDRTPDQGELLVGGVPPQHWPAKDFGRFRSVMVQQQQLSFAFSVHEVVAMGRLPHPADPSTDKIITDEAIDAADLNGLRDRDVTTLSGGEGARAAFARALAQTTPLMLLDEPTAALDLRHQEALLGTASALRDHGCCVVVVLHDLNLAARYADRILIFDHGLLVADGTPDSVLTADLIEQVYQQPVRVLRQPGTDLPLIVPIPGPTTVDLGSMITSMHGPTIQRGSSGDEAAITSREAPSRSESSR